MPPRRGIKPTFADRDPREEKKELDGLKPRTEARMENAEIIETIKCQNHLHQQSWQVVASKALEKDIRHIRKEMFICMQMKCSRRSNSLGKTW